MLYLSLDFKLLMLLYTSILRYSSFKPKGFVSEGFAAMIKIFVIVTDLPLLFFKTGLALY